MNIIEQIRHFISAIFFCAESCQKDLRTFDLLFSFMLVILSILVSIYNARNHMCNYSNPYFQDKIIVILFMSPFYSLSSYLGIAYTEYAEYINLVRDIYEAFLLFTFFYLIFAYLAYDSQQDKIIDIKVYNILIEQQPNQVSHMFPIYCFTKPYKFTNIAKAKYFVYRCKRFILQFLVIKPLSSFLLIIFNIWPEKTFCQIIVYWIEWIVCISISLSLYYLVLFYHALKKPLNKYNPLLKFLTIKITLFFTFWQKIFLSNFQEEILVNFDQTVPDFNGEKILLALENSLVCVEMFIMAVAAGIAYSYKEFVCENSKTATIGEVIHNNWYFISMDFRLIKPKKFGFNNDPPVANDFAEHERDRYSSYIVRQYDIELENRDILKKKLIDQYL